MARARLRICRALQRGAQRRVGSLLTPQAMRTVQGWANLSEDACWPFSSSSRQRGSEARQVGSVRGHWKDASDDG